MTCMLAMYLLANYILKLINTVNEESYICKENLCDFCGFAKIFPTNALSNGSTFSTDKAKAAKIFPTCGRNPVSHETFLSLNLCHLHAVIVIEFSRSHMKFSVFHYYYFYLYVCISRVFLKEFNNLSSKF